MKKSITLIISLSLCVSFAFCQFELKKPVNKEKQAASIIHESVFKSDTFKLPDRDKLKKLDSQYYSFIGKRKVDIDGKIHWYALEKENDSIYWANVNCKRLIIEFKKGVDINNNDIKQLFKKTKLTRVIKQPMHRDIQNLYLFEVSDGNKNKILEIIKKVRNNKNVLYAEPEIIIKRQACVPNDRQYNLQWGPSAIGMEDVWCYTNVSNNRIAVIDDACDYSHPDLNNVQFGYDFAMKDNDPYPDYSGQSHGTHVSGIVGATRNNGIGVAGISMDTIYFAKVMNDDPTNENLDNTAIVDALNTIANRPKIKVINMSLGSYSPSQAGETAINNVINNDKLIIASAGNDNSSSPLYPAAYTNVISVAAVGVDNTYNYAKASYSNFGSTIDISAPGGEASNNLPIWSTLPKSTYGGVDWEGTSMAAPHITGVAAIIWAANPFLSNAQVRSILETQVYDLGAPGWDQFFGSGMTNAYAALNDACKKLSILITPGSSTTFCIGESVTLSAPFNSNVLYQWKKNGTNISGATNNTYVVSSSGNYELYIQTLGGCQTTSNQISVNVLNLPSAPTAISGSVSVCTNQNNVTYSIAPIPNATSYSWTLPNGAIGNSNTNSISVNYASNAFSGNITVKGVNTCGSGANGSLSILVNQTPPTPTISSNTGTTICSGNSITLLSNSLSGNQWYLNGNQISGATGTTYSTSIAGAYTLITKNNGCSSLPSTPLTLVSVQTPATPSISVSGNTSICSNNSVILTGSSSSGNQWYLNNNALTGATSNTYTANSSGSYTLIITSNGCPSSPSAPVVVSVNPSPAKPDITWNGTQLSTSATGVSYQWLLNNNPVGSSSSYTPTEIGNYQVKVTANNCSNTSDVYKLVVLGIDPSVTLSPYNAQIFPNPAKNDIAVKFGEAPDVTVDIQLINNTGTVIKSVKTKNKITGIKVNELPSGVYYIKIIGGKYNQVRKVEVIK